MRKRGKVDDNQTEIVQALRQAGLQVYSLASVGGGFADVICCRGGVHLYLLEIKMPKSRKRLSAEQKVFHSRWPVQVVTSIEEALTAVGAIKGV